MAGTAVLEREIQQEDVRTKNSERVATKEESKQAESRQAESKQAESTSSCYDFLRFADTSAWEKYAQRVEEREEAEAELFTKASERVESNPPVESPMPSPTVGRPATRSYVSDMPKAPSSPKHTLFADYAYINGELLRRDPETDVMMPVFEGSSYIPASDASPFGSVFGTENLTKNSYVEAAKAIAKEVSEEDAIPSRRTMETVVRPAATVREVARPQIKQGLLSAIAVLSTKTKVAIIAVAVAIFMAIIMICINTNILRSLDSDLNNLKSRAAEQQTTYERLQRESDLYTDPESEIVRDYAESNGMTK